MLQSSSLDLFHRRKAILRNGDVNGIEALKPLWKCWRALLTSIFNGLKLW